MRSRWSPLAVFIIGFLVERFKIYEGKIDRQPGFSTKKPKYNRKNLSILFCGDIFSS
jgi:hypothetical protein